LKADFSDESRLTQRFIAAEAAHASSDVACGTNELPVIVSEPRKYFGPVDIQRIRIRLFDEYGRTLYMNSADYSFCLSLKMMYDV
jgi:hypothetical protein